jgi:hypothetical protein
MLSNGIQPGIHSHHEILSQGAEAGGEASTKATLPLR